MTIETLKNNLPELAKDIKLNVTNVLLESGSPDLTNKQIISIALAAAYTSKNAKLIEAMLIEAMPLLNSTELAGVKTAAIIMAMNNVYYRFIHLVSDKSYATMPAKLRMNAIGNPGMDKIDFELCCLAVSALNGCGMCMDAHTKALIKMGVSQQAVQSAIRIAAVFNAFALSLEIC